MVFIKFLANLEPLRPHFYLTTTPSVRTDPTFPTLIVIETPTQTPLPIPTSTEQSIVQTTTSRRLQNLLAKPLPNVQNFNYEKAYEKLKDLQAKKPTILRIKPGNQYKV